MLTLWSLLINSLTYEFQPQLNLNNILNENNSFERQPLKLNQGFQAFFISIFPEYIYMTHNRSYRQKTFIISHTTLHCHNSLFNYCMCYIVQRKWYFSTIIDWALGCPFSWTEMNVTLILSLQIMCSPLHFQVNYAYSTRMFSYPQKRSYILQNMKKT